MTFSPGSDQPQMWMGLSRCSTMWLLRIPGSLASHSRIVRVAGQQKGGGEKANRCVDAHRYILTQSGLGGAAGCMYTDSVPPRENLEKALAMARDLVESGDLANAAAICTKILQSAPDQPQALHLLGIAAIRQGRGDEAAELLRRAVRSDPNFAVALNDFGNLLAQQGRFAEAAAQLPPSDRCVAPNLAEPHNNLGNLLQMAGSLDRRDSVLSHRRGPAARLRRGFPEPGQRAAPPWPARRSGGRSSRGTGDRSGVCAGHRPFGGPIETDLQLEPAGRSDGDLSKPSSRPGRRQ